MAREDWDSEPAPIDRTDDIELIINWGFDENGDPTLQLRASVLLVDADGNELGRKYVRDTDKVKALFTAAQLGGIDAVGDRIRAKANSKFIPAP